MSRRVGNARCAGIVRSAGIAIAIAAAILAATALASGCRKGWRTDMWYQPSRRPEEAPRPEPDGSAPLGAPLPLHDRDEAESLVNPRAGDPASARHGAFLFAPHCSPCHGDAGHGGGPVSKFFPPAPDLAYGSVVARSDGYIFGTITFGGRAMPPQAEGLTIDDRWDLVNAVRAIQRAGPGAPETAPAAAPGAPAAPVIPAAPAARATPAAPDSTRGGKAP